MKMKDIRVGGIYTAKVSNNVVGVEVLSINKREGNTYRKGGTTYTCKNLKTGREVLIKSAAKFRGEVKNRPANEQLVKQIAKDIVDGKFAINLPPGSIEGEMRRQAREAIATGAYSCCARPVGSPHADNCPLFPIYGFANSAVTTSSGKPEVTPIMEGKKGSDPIAPAALAALATPTAQTDSFEKNFPTLTAAAKAEAARLRVKSDLSSDPLEDKNGGQPTLPISRLTTEPLVGLDQLASLVAAPVQQPPSTTSAGTAAKVKKTPGQIIAERNSRIVAQPAMVPVSPVVSLGTSAPNVVASGLAQRLQTPHISHGRGGKHLIVIARAGTGKTFTLTKGLANTFGIAQPDVIPSDQQRAVWDAMNESKGRIRNSATAMVCFNNGIAAELKSKVPQGCKAMTNHTMGSLSIRRNFKLAGGDDGSGVYDARVLDIICELFGKDRKEMAQQYPGLSGILKELVGLCKQNLIGFDFRSKQWTPSTDSDYWAVEIFDLCNHYGVDLSNEDMDGSNFHDFTDLVLQWVPKILERCKDVGRDSQIDFNDMIWLPVVLNLPIFMNDLLLVDEAQDLNPCQQALVQRAGKRLILCGDPKQAIYGFAGADVDSLPTMEKILGNSSLGVQTLPLNVTRRCGRAIVKEAQKIVPDFYAHESNPEGVVNRGRYDVPRSSVDQEGRNVVKSYHGSVQQGDMLLCRVNAPLVSQCFKFLKEGRAANIQGRNIGKGIIDLVNKLECQTVPELISKIDEWSYYETQKENARRDPNEARLIAITDKAECLRSFTDGSKEIVDVIKKIQSIFVNASDENEKGAPAVKREECINLSSIHKAKGLEAQRVFLLEPEGAKVPHPMAKSAWQKEQEMNLRYVAITRAIGELVYVS